MFQQHCTPQLTGLPIRPDRAAAHAVKQKQLLMRSNRLIPSICTWGYTLPTLGWHTGGTFCSKLTCWHTVTYLAVSSAAHVLVTAVQERQVQHVGIRRHLQRRRGRRRTGELVRWCASRQQHQPGGTHSRGGLLGQVRRGNTNSKAADAATPAGQLQRHQLLQRPQQGDSSSSPALWPSPSQCRRGSRSAAAPPGALQEGRRGEQQVNTLRLSMACAGGRII